MEGLVNFQLGKEKITDNFISALKNAFKRHKNVKISVLKSASRDREEIKKIADEICSRLEDKEHGFNCRVVGFTLNLRKYSKAKVKR